MIITTTNSIEGKDISRYLGIVTENMYVSLYNTKGLSFKESLSMRKAYQNGEENIEQSKKEIFAKLEEKAKALGANAIVGVSMDVEMIFEASTLGISVMGTAVFYT